MFYKFNTKIISRAGVVYSKASNSVSDKQNLTIFKSQAALKGS